ncbi:G-type lectin S-receptor-like serine/threonine protein kinase RLK1-like, partial [Trifolium medium]|nr:G-type lectin S-receptor-like serine/threonine protein kinase RLK1-like [Trifolium medium]
MSCDGSQVILPATVAEFRVGDGGLSYYNVNVVEGFNVPLAVTPVSGTGKHLINCSSAGCPTNLNTMCPTVALSCSTKSYKIIFCPASSTGSLNQNVSVGDSLTAENGTTQWMSPSGDFAFGFFQLPNELFLLAIWYAKIQNDSIIWYANGDNPAPKGSTLVLNDSHGLVLTSPKGSELWRSSEFTLG